MATTAAAAADGKEVPTESTLVTFDILPAATSSLSDELESVETLVEKLKKMMAEPSSPLYKGSVTRYVDPSFMRSTELELDAEVRRASQSLVGSTTSSLPRDASLEPFSEMEPGSPSTRGSIAIRRGGRNNTGDWDREAKILSEGSAAGGAGGAAVGTKRGKRSARGSKTSGSGAAREDIGMTAAEMNRLMNNFPKNWDDVNRVSEIIGKAKGHSRMVAMRALTLEHRNKLDMQSGDPGLVRQYAITALLNLLDDDSKIRLILDQLTRELSQQASFGSALRASSYGTELCLCSVSRNMTHLERNMSEFILEFAKELTTESGPIRTRVLAVNPSHESDPKVLAENKQLVLEWATKLLNAIIDSGKGSPQFQLAPNALYVAISNKYEKDGASKDGATGDDAKAGDAKAGDGRAESSESRATQGSDSKGEEKTAAGKGASAASGDAKHDGDADGGTKNAGSDKKQPSNSVLILMGGFLFLRLLNPRLLNPSDLLVAPKRDGRYDAKRVLEALESPEMSANLKLLCKMLMTVSNNRQMRRGGYMEFLNPWLRENRARVDAYLSQFCVRRELKRHTRRRPSSDFASFHQERWRQDLRTYLTLLLPPNESKLVVSAPIDEKTHMPGPSRQTKQWRQIKSEKIKDQARGRASQVFAVASALVIGIEKVTKKLLLNKRSRTETHLLQDSFVGEVRVDCPSQAKNRAGHPFDSYTFIAYAPLVFVRLQLLFGVLGADLAYSLGQNLPYIDFVMNKKQPRDFYYYTYDKRFVVKQVSKSEFVFWCSVLKSYYKHIRSNRDSLLARILGMYEIVFEQRSVAPKYIVVMVNVFYGQQSLECRFNLKASTGRKASRAERTQTPSILKDDDFMNHEDGQGGFHFSHAGGKVISQLRKDCKWLTEHKIQGYSLLVGTYVERTLASERHIFEKEQGYLGHYGLSDERESCTLTDAEYYDKRPERKKQRAYMKKLCKELYVEFMRDQQENVQAKATTSLMSTLRDSATFRGILSAPVERRGTFRKKVVYIGIINILRKYNARKRVENFFRSMNGKGHSAVSPSDYGERMVKFVADQVRW